MDNANMRMIASAMAVGWAACALAVGRAGALADERDLRPLEMWGGRKAHPAVVHSVTAVPGGPWTLSLRGDRVVWGGSAAPPQQPPRKVPGSPQSRSADTRM